MDILIVGAGGAIGAVLRYWLALFLVDRVHLGTLPVTTLAVNLLGSFALGAVLGWLFASVPGGEDILADRLAVFLAVGVCGSFTTYSTFAADTGYLVRHRDYRTIAVYIVVTLAGAVAAFLGGFALVR